MTIHLKGIEGLSPEQIFQLRKPIKQGTKPFIEIIKSQLNEVNKLQNEASKIIQGFATGDVKNVHDVIIAMEKADISFNLMLEIRNKLIQSYQEIMRMQV